MKRIYTLLIPSKSQTAGNTQGQRNIATSGTLEGESPSVEPISLQPGQRGISAEFVGKYSETMASEFRELFNSDAIKEVPFIDFKNPEDRAYYTLGDIRKSPNDPREKKVQRIEGRMTKVGTKKTHWRTIATNVQRVPNLVDSYTAATVAVSSAANNVRWFFPTSEEVVEANIHRQKDTRLGEINQYRPRDTGWRPQESRRSPWLIYSLSMLKDGISDPVLYDTHNRSKEEVNYEEVYSESTPQIGGATVSGSNYVSRTWQKVYDTGHDFAGVPIVENGLCQAEFDERTKALRFSRFEDYPRWTENRYVPVDLPATDWDLTDVDFKRAGDDRITGQVLFRDSAESASLDFAIKRGIRDIIWSIPENQGSIPSSLINHLQPTASDRVFVANSDRTILDRGEASA